ncbi:MAG: indolepyruvate ferredoxin oxidoreductase, partial [Methanosarcinales archaeon]|nr:indolepyruvate ferredoxin oxidoreductase [Methanosarcinales archaeon]
EETEPVIEQQLQGMGNIRGKLTGHLPHTIIEINDIENAISGIEQHIVDIPVCVETLDNRGEPRIICPDCDFMVLYGALSRLKEKYCEQGLIVAGDVGCSIRTTAPPLNLADVGFCLGSSISVATGANGVAITGDYALAHSGICALIDAVQKKRDILIVVVKNDVAAMTGGQDVPDLTEMVMGYVEDTMVISSKTSEDDMFELFDSRYSASGVSVVFVQGMCQRDLEKKS